MVPSDNIIFKASSTEISKRCISCSAIIKKNPEVGFGVVGTKTVFKAGASAYGCICPVKKANVQQP